MRLAGKMCGMREQEKMMDKKKLLKIFKYGKYALFGLIFAYYDISATESIFFWIIALALAVTDFIFMNRIESGK